MIRRFLSKVLLIFASLIVSSTTLFSENNTSPSTSDVHELTLYLMPTLHPLDWESPASLYKSMRQCYLKTMLKPNNYLLGHLAVGLQTSLLPQPLLIGQMSVSLKEKLDLIFKQQAGFAIVGAPLKGKIERHEELEYKLKLYTKRDKLAFIRYKINKKAAQRVLDFIAAYTSKMNEQHSPSDFYGGAFWPRYHQEGSGCSAFGIVMLELANIIEQAEIDAWKLRLKVPMHLIGGEYNDNLKVKYTTIRKTNAWYEGDGLLNQDYILYSVYDPSVMFDWVMKERAQPNHGFQPIEENGVPGVVVDMTHAAFDENEPLFIHRTEPNLFIDHHFKKINPPTLKD